MEFCSVYLDPWCKEEVEINEENMDKQEEEERGKEETVEEKGKVEIVKESELNHSWNWSVS